MAKARSVYVCESCGHVAPGWLGRCPSCGAWGSLEQVAVGGEGAAGVGAAGSFGAGSGAAAIGIGRDLSREAPGARAYSLVDIGSTSEERITTGIGEFDRALGGGLVKGSLTLVSGDPGIGKSTLLLQMCAELGRENGAGVLYMSGEESARQIKLRADRIGLTSGRRGSRELPALFISSDTRLEAVARLIEERSPGVVIIDSVQTTHSADIPSTAGSIAQIRGVTLALMRLAKATGVTFVVVGHVTKEGSIAGPKALEHMVDAALYFEGERHAGFRILRAVKNRFGSTNEMGVFEMTETGLSEVANPSAAMIGERAKGAPGSVVAPVVEGTRPMLVEIQALASRTLSPNPRRQATGVDYNRVSLMAAILEKRAGLKLYERDLFVNAAGGVRVAEPAIDLAIVAAIASSYCDRPYDPRLAMTGEVGLTGEIRSVNRVEARVAEAERLGFTHCAIPASNMQALRRQAAPGGSGLILLPVKHIAEIIELCNG